jgi:DNA-binding response OmpR family regulator
MQFQALLVLTDNSAAELLSHVLANFQVDQDLCAAPGDAAHLLEEKTFDIVLVDFDDSHAAAQVIDNVRHSSTAKNAVAVCLLSDPSKVRSVFGMGANFVLYKPVNGEHANASLRSAIALLKRERRRKFRVPVQLPVTLSWQDTPEVEGIMLDVSEDGMDVLSAQPLQGSQNLEVHFSLPDLTQLHAHAQVVWANSNGQAGLQFADFSEESRETLSAWLGANSPELPAEAEPLSQCKLSDLSLGACYIETESPFPRRTKIDLCLRAANLEVRARGFVRVMHPEHGMGVEFASRTSEERAEVEHFIEFLSSQPDVMPQLSVTPKSIDFSPNSGDSSSEYYQLEDELIQLLRREENMTQEEFLAELHAQRRSQAHATTA